ncbi:hypothetical protein MUP77_07550 [Candidatus Bathyarchaeota archaeon]|nr:hypothetical protein [Candidatus Bathyarchaeota archaeon]
MDMADYIQQVCDPLEIESVLAIGVGNKGPVAQHYWQDIRKIKRGYMCDIWTIKPAPSLWIPLKMNALDLLTVLKPKSVDIVQSCGFLEHLSLKEAIKFLFDVAEVIARKVVFLSCATTCHAQEGIAGYNPDYKVKLDKNPYHEYKTIWSHQQFEAWGYKTNLEDIVNGRFALDGEIEAWKVFVDK